MTWTVTSTVATAWSATAPVIGKQLVGHVDNSAYPAINVDIQMTLVTPADAKGPVPVMMMFGGGVLPQALGGPARAAGGAAAPPSGTGAGADPPADASS